MTHNSPSGFKREAPEGCCWRRGAPSRLHTDRGVHVLSSGVMATPAKSGYSSTTHCSVAGSVELGELGTPPSRITGFSRTVSSAVMALGGLGLQGEPVATSPIGRTLYASIAVGVGLRDISAQVQGVGIALHDSASSRTAYAVFVVPQRLKCSFSWSWFRRDESQIHQDFRNRSQPYRLEMRPV